MLLGQLGTSLTASSVAVEGHVNVALSMVGFTSGFVPSLNDM